MREMGERLPFKDELEPAAETGFECSVARFKNNKGFVVKRMLAASEMGVSLSPEARGMSLHEYARERYIKGHQFLKRYLGDFVPETHFVLGQETNKASPELFLAQERIHGKTLQEIEKDQDKKDSSSFMGYRFQREFSEALKYPMGYPQNAEQNFFFFYAPGPKGLEKMRELDKLVCLSLKMWRDTLQQEGKDLPLGMSTDRVIRRKKSGEGFLPEITNPRNIIYGKKEGEEKESFFIVDYTIILVPPGYLITPSRYEAAFLGKLLRLIPLYSVQGLLHNAQFLEKYPKWPETTKWLASFLKSEAGDFYEKLKKEFSGDKIHQDN